MSLIESGIDIMTNYELSFLERIEKQNAEISKKIDNLNATIEILNNKISHITIDHNNDPRHDLMNSWCP